MNRFILAAAFILAALAGSAGSVTTFSTGFSLPEDISPVPSGFGSLPAGSYLVTDAIQNFTTPGVIYSVPATGGSPTAFTTFSNFNPIGGVFLPSTFGSIGGQYLAAGLNFTTNDGAAYAVSSSGGQTNVVSSVGSAQFADAAIAPTGFDGVGGDVILANEDGSIYALNSSLNTSVISGGAFSNVTPFGLAFVPEGFGSIGGDLLVTDTDTGDIYAISPTGAVSLFATVPLAAGQSGLRQLAFAPSGFGSYGGDLFVSVSGSQAGGGIAGSVDVLNAEGEVVAYLPEAAVGAPYDPRGIYFVSDSQVLIADSDPSILSAGPSNFTPGSPAPEPSSIVLTLLAIPVFGILRRRTQA
jgi:hypothetical protein